MTHQRPPRKWRSLPELSINEAAAVLGVSRSRAYELSQSGELPTHPDHLGRHRVLPADLEPLLATQDATQPDLFDQGDLPRPETRHAPSAPPEPPQAATQAPPKVPERTPPTAAFRAAKNALKQRSGGAP